MRIWQTLAVLLLCLILSGATACGGRGGDEVSQQLTDVVLGDLTVSVSASGNITAYNETNLVASSSGKVDKLYVEEGENVNEGDVLAKLDTGPLELSLAQAETALAQAEYNLDQAEDPYSKKEIRNARDDVEDAEEYLNYAKSMLIQAYFEHDEVAISQWEAEVYLAQINLGIAEDTLDAMLSETDDDVIDIMEMQVNSAEQALAEAQKQLDEATFTAPFDGVVAGVYVEEGDIIAPAMPIIYLIDLTTMELNAEVDEIDVPDVKVGQKAIIEVDALPSIQLEGEVTLIGSLPIVEAGLVLYEAKIGFDVPQGLELKVGMNATADIIIHQRTNVMLVPDRAVTQDTQGNPMVRVMVNEQIQDKSVIVGISDGYQTEIISGLQVGDIVVAETKTKPTESGGLFS
jgi:multidrug efflux pump subunit AcrA (membrane-fusion protein)